jgi:cell division protein FtsQ
LRFLRIAAGLLIAASVAYGGWLAWGSPPFRLQRVEVAGASHVSAKDVVVASGLLQGMHLLRVSTRDVAHRIDAIPWVRNTTVERIIPSKVRIIITERTPAAVVAIGGKTYLADPNGVIIGEGNAELLKINGLPLDQVNAGQRLQLRQFFDAIAITGSLPADLRPKLAGIQAETVDKITLRMSDGLSILYGAAEDMPAKNFAITSLLQDAAKRAEAFTSIDVRVPSRPAATKR